MTIKSIVTNLLAALGGGWLILEIAGAMLRALGCG